MSVPALLIVTGHPATGKTTLAGALAYELALPLVSKDGIKETIFDAVGWRDRAWSRQVGVAALALLYRDVEGQLAAGRSLIVESNFRPDLDTPRMLALAARRPFRPIQLRCVASSEVMVERYLRRIAAGERHPGHVEAPDEGSVALMRSLGHIEPLGLAGPTLTVDTTDVAALDMAAVFAWVRARLANTPGPP